MYPFSELDTDLIPLFPLPDVVLFPRKLLPLHIFEERYVRMTVDALADSRRIAMAVLQPGYEPSYFTSHAPIFPVVGVGEIVHCEQRPDCRFDLMLCGLSRARITEEVCGRPYRRARLQVLEPIHSGGPCEFVAWRDRLLKGVEAIAGLSAACRQQLAALARSDLPLGDVADLVASCAPMSSCEKYELLAEPDVLARAACVTGWLRAYSARIRQRAARSSLAVESSN